MPVLRPVAHLEAASRDYPGAWKQYAAFLAQRDQIGDWPSWCYCPMHAAYAIVSGGGDSIPRGRELDIARLAALAAWRTTQGVYRFDPTLFDDLSATPLDGDLPVEHLQRLPEWCVYVETPGQQQHGFFAHLDADSNTGRPELRILLDSDLGLLPVILHLVGTIDQSISAALDRGIENAATSGVPYAAEAALRSAGAARAELIERTTPLVSLLLYLCAGEAETRPTRDAHRGHGDAAPLKRGKHGEPFAPPGKPEVWETGFRLGAALRTARAEGPEATGATVRGHVRRAHWHTFISGPRDGERSRDVRWLPPIPVKLDAVPGPTIRRTK